MRSRFLLFIVFFIILTGCQNDKKECSYIKDYYQKIYLAEEAFYSGDYSKAYDFFKGACEKCELLNQPYIYEMEKFARTAVILGKYEEALGLIEKSFLHGYQLSEFQNKSEYAELMKTDNWKRLEKRYPELRQEYVESINVELREELRMMIKKDQSVRKAAELDFDLMRETDSLNNIRLKEIFEEYGYPNEKLIGGFSFDSTRVEPDILLFHMRDKDYYPNRLKEFTDKGISSPLNIAMFVDSHRRGKVARKEGGFLYALYSNTTPEQIEDYPNLDKRRMEIGMCPMDLQKRISELRNKYYENLEEE